MGPVADYPGKPGPKPKANPAHIDPNGVARHRLRIGLTLSPECLNELQEQALADGVSQSAHIEALIWERASKRK